MAKQPMYLANLSHLKQLFVDQSGRIDGWDLRELADKRGCSNSTMKKTLKILTEEGTAIMTTQPSAHQPGQWVLKGVHEADLQRRQERRDRREARQHLFAPLAQAALDFLSHAQDDPFPKELYDDFYQAMGRVKAVTSNHSKGFRYENLASKEDDPTKAQEYRDAAEKHRYEALAQLRLLAYIAPTEET